MRRARDPLIIVFPPICAFTARLLRRADLRRMSNTLLPADFAVYEARLDRRPKRYRDAMSPRLDDDDLDASLLIRTDFSDDDAWETLVAEASAAYGPDQFSAAFVPVSDASFDGMAPADLAEVPGSALVVFAADTVSMFHPERTLLVVNRDEAPGQFFRVVLAEAWGPENNLRLANMDFDEFANAADADGVFRGFAE